MTADPGWPRAVLFDLDGTLIDSVPDLHASINIMLAEAGLGPLSVDDVKGMVGNGIRTLVKRALTACGKPPEPEGLDKFHDRMIAIYSDHLTVLTRLYPGAREALEQLRSAGIATAVVTNKPQIPSEAILDHFRLLPLLGAVVGGDAGVEKKPAPAMLFAALDELGVEPHNAIMVGDSGTDVAAARAAGIPAIVVCGGYTVTPPERLGADLLIDSLDGLEQGLVECRAILGPG